MPCCSPPRGCGVSVAQTPSPSSSTSTAGRPPPARARSRSRCDAATRTSSAPSTTPRPVPPPRPNGTSSRSSRRDAPRRSAPTPSSTPDCCSCRRASTASTARSSSRHPTPRRGRIPTAAADVAASAAQELLDAGAADLTGARPMIERPRRLRATPAMRRLVAETAAAPCRPHPAHVRPRRRDRRRCRSRRCPASCSTRSTRCGAPSPGQRMPASAASCCSAFPSTRTRSAPVRPTRTAS